MKITLKTTPYKEFQLILDSLQKAVTQALEKKRRLGQYAVVCRDGKAVMIGEVWYLISRIKQESK